MIKRPSWREPTRSARANSFRWKDSEDGGTPVNSPIRAGGQTGRAGLHQGSEDGEARVLRERRQGDYSGFCFHVSIIS
jgi:hypothetical protein